jgi:hypothetical protein
MTNIRRYQTPANPALGETMLHEPRDFGRGFDSERKPDQQRTNALRQALADFGIVDIGAFLGQLDAKNLPPQLVQTNFPQFIAAVATPVLLIPKNIRRRSFQVNNFASLGDIVFSYDAPMQMATIAGTALFAGTPVPQKTYFQESNGSVSINDIWVVCNDPNATYPVPVWGVEGTLSLAGNPR